MDQNLDNKKEFKEKLILFFKENKLKLLAFSAILISFNNLSKLKFSFKIIQSINRIFNLL